MDKISITGYATADYNRQTTNLAYSKIEQQINRAADSFLFPVTRITSSYTQNQNDAIILADATAGSITITLLPALEWEQKRLTVKKIDSSGNSVVVDASGAETIDGAANKSTSTQYNSYDFVSEGGQVFII